MARWNSKDAITYVKDAGPERRLERELGWPILIGLGLGATISVGSLSAIEAGFNGFGPAVLISILLAAAVCVCVALAFAEMGTMTEAPGSAYSYCHVALGALPAWIIGWCLILEYLVFASWVAASWSSMLTDFLAASGMELPAALASSFDPQGMSGGIVNLPAILIVVLVGGVLAVDTRAGGEWNLLLVLLWIVAMILLVVMALPFLSAGPTEQYAPSLMPGADGQAVPKQSIVSIAGLLMITWLGFEAIATTAEEAAHPRRHLPLALIGSVLACVLISAGAALTWLTAIGGSSLGVVNAVSYAVQASRGDPLTDLLLRLGSLAVMFSLLYAQSRVYFALARDRLMPDWIGRISRDGKPIAATMFTIVVVGGVAGLVPAVLFNELVGAAVLAGLIVWASVPICMLVLRRRQPLPEGHFRAPLAWITAIIAVSGCTYAWFAWPFGGLRDGEDNPQLYLLGWLGVGLSGFFAYGRRRLMTGAITGIPEEAATSWLEEL